MKDQDQEWRASDWMIQLTEAPEDEELRRRFEDWLSADPQNVLDWEEISQTHALLGALAPMPQRRGAVFRAGRPLAWGMAVAACLALLILSGALPRIGPDAVTGTAEIRTLTLADGSTVTLAAHSAIDFDLSDRERRVHLIEGSAFFQVAPDRDRPFRVVAPDLTTTVLGTAFEVAVREDASRVAVQSGTVRVQAADGHQVSDGLRRGETALVREGGAITLGRQAPGQIAEWRSGRLAVNDRPVAEVVDALSDYFQGFVLLRGSRLAAEPITGIYTLAQPEAALEAIAAAQGVSFYRVTPWLMIIQGK